MRLRKISKRAFDLVATLAASPLWLIARAERALSRREHWFAAFAELLRLVPARIGLFLRRAYYRRTLERCGEACYVGSLSAFAHREARVGNCVYIGARCTIGTEEIGDDALIGSNVDVLSGRQRHNFDDPTRPVPERGGVFEKVRIGLDTWIGDLAVILADVRDRCVVAAGALVPKPEAPGGIAVGNLARIVGTRGARQPLETRAPECRPAPRAEPSDAPLAEP